MMQLKRREVKKARKRGSEYDVARTLEELERIHEEVWKKKVSLIELYREAVR